MNIFRYSIPYKSVINIVQENIVVTCCSIGPGDLNEHNLKLILGLIWTLILRYQLGIGQEEEPPAPATEVKAGEKKPEQRKTKKASQSAKKILLGWVQANLPDVKVTNFTTDWNDGRKLSALVDSMKPGLIPNYATLDPARALENTSKAMDLAEENFGIPQVF